MTQVKFDVKAGDKNNMRLVGYLANTPPPKDFKEGQEQFEQLTAARNLAESAPSLYNAAYSALQALYAMPKKKQGFYQYLINDLLKAIQEAKGIIN